MTRRSSLLVLCAGLAFVGCAPVLGDNCSLSTECSINGDRICDLSLPGGYCSVLGCEADGCPDDGRCVEWRGEPVRTAVRYCMATCSSDADCRSGEGYRCLSVSDADFPQDEVTVAGQLMSIPVARVVDLNVDGSAARFCTYVKPN